jgi:pyruvate dehydrogenase E1 component alpha subunit
MEIAKRYSEWKMRCPTHLSIGQELAGSVVGMLVNNNDYAVSSHRSHAHYLGKGGSLNQLIAELYGKETGCSGGRGGSMHLIDDSVGFKASSAIVGNSIPIGVGLGLSIQLNKSNQISCIFFGDGATEEGVFYESLNFSAVRKLPVLFICENNLYSVYSPLSIRQPNNRKIFEMADAIGIESNHFEGTDSIEVFKGVEKVIKKIRSSGRPQFIEISTYRWLEHCGPNDDNNIGYRDSKEFEMWKNNDPILNLESYLKSNNVLTDLLINSMKKEIEKEINEAFIFAENSSFPAKDTLTDFIYK